MEDRRAGSGGHALSVSTKLVYATGDHAVNVVLSAASLLYFLFLTQQAGLGPGLAGLVVLAARVVDAVTDPLMGRVSDRTRWAVGRRRGYFLLGALPFGLFFAAMWQTLPADSEAVRFAYYVAVYIGVSVAMTVLSVPYLALLPEMATDYDERTSLNAWRGALAILGTFVAIGMNSFARALGDDAHAWQVAGVVFGIWLVIPWLGVFRVSFERPESRRESDLGFVDGLRMLASHRSYRLLTLLYILGRIAIDLISVMLKIYFVYWLGRQGDFDIAMAIFLLCVVLALPFWLRISRGSDKKTIFVVGCVWWGLSQSAFYLIEPDWPRWIVFAAAAFAAIGFAVADLMPWAMLGEVVDEDELRSDERREGVYVGFFMFLRKLGGAIAVALVGLALELVGYDGDLEAGEQPARALEAIRWMTSFVPAAFLALAVWVALRYPLGRDAHRRVLEELDRRRHRRTT